MIGRWHWHCSCQSPWFPVVHAWASVEFGPVKISAWQTAGNQRPRKFPWGIPLSSSNQQPANQQHFAVSFLQFFFKLSWYCFPRFPKPISQRFHVHMLMPQSEFRLRSFQSEGKGLPRKVMTGYWKTTSSSNHWATWGIDIHRIPNIDDSPLRREKNQTSSTGKSTTLTKDIFKYKALEKTLKISSQKKTHKTPGWTLRLAHEIHYFKAVFEPDYMSTYHIILYYIILYEIISYHIISYYMIVYYIISYYIIPL